MTVLGFVNRYSRGVQAVQDELRTNGNGEADFKLHLGTAFLVVENIAIREPMKEGEKPNKESQKPNKEPNKEQHTLRQIEIICNMIRSNPASTYSNFMDTLGISYSSVYERVKILKQKGILSREGGLYGGRWKINEDLYFQHYPSSSTNR